MRAIAFIILLNFSVLAFAEGFIIEDIKIEGNKRISEGTVLNYLDLSKGDSIDSSQSIEVIKTLFKTGFFKDIQLHRDGNVLRVVVDERPSISKITLAGNKLLSEEELTDALDRLDISEGEQFNPSVLDKIEQELTQLYYSLGKYSVRIETKLNPLSEGLVGLDLTISEGAAAKVRDINITGNTKFTDNELLKDFSLSIPSQSFFGSADDYSQAKLAGDVKAVQSKYLDNGFLDFDVDSSQVTISPNRKDINVTLNVSEGEAYTLSEVELSGQFVIDKADLEMLVPFKAGDVFSRKLVTKSVKQITSRLGEEGYAFANVNAIPKLDKETHNVALNIVIDPGQKMNVRYISFTGNEKTIDRVLRREMRQLESAPFSASKVERSKIRLQRLKFIAGVSFRYNRVKNIPDQLDIVVNISERFSGNFTLGIGYSEGQGALLNMGITHDNVFGSGNSVSVTFNNSESQEKYLFSYNNPYYTKDGVSRGFSFSYGKTDASELSISNYVLDQGSVAINYGFPLSEFNTLKLNVGLQLDELTLSDTTADEIYDFIIDNNDKYDVATDTATITTEDYQTAFISTSFSYDTRNRTIFPDSGLLHRITLELYGGDLDYYRLKYRNQFVRPITQSATFSIKSRIGEGDGYNETSDLPFYEKFHTGGVRTVRGYNFHSLGPKDSKNLPFGGNFSTVFNVEVLFKLKDFGDPKTFRLGVFYDAGNVFAKPSDFEWNELKSSAGVSAKWYSPVGPLEFSYSNQFNTDSDDSTRNFQFALGSSF